ncbi:MAG: hypothetical protein ACERKJ_08290 [Candidatus Dadabacteria bacterium]
MSREIYGETFRKAYEKGYQGINPRKRAKNRRLLEESLEFLKGEENTKNPEGTMKVLFALYEEVDSKADYIKPGEREFFPVDKSQRTLERFLEGFRYIYFILKRAEERLYLSNAFDNFWEQCRAYLRRCEYSEKFISRVCAKDTFFYRQSFNFWRQEFDDSEEGFSVMYEYFKACFGLRGNDEYCCVSQGRDVTYDWRRMKTSYEKFYEKRFYLDPVLEPPDYVPPSKEQLEMLRERIRSNKKDVEDACIAADALLLQIQKRNRKAIFNTPNIGENIKNDR